MRQQVTLEEERQEWGGREGNGGTRGRGDQAERERKETWGEGEVEVEKPREMCPDCAGEATGKQV